MDITYGFFNANKTGEDLEGNPKYDREYNANNFAEFFSSLIGNGVSAAIPNCFKVVPAGGKNLQISPGFAWIEGYYVKLTSPHTLTLPNTPMDSQNSIIYAVVLRLDKESRTLLPQIKSGTPSPNPQIPPITINGNIHEIMLGYITLKSGDSQIDPNRIIDTRADTSVCGIIDTFASMKIALGSIDTPKLAPNSVSQEYLSSIPSSAWIAEGVYYKANINVTPIETTWLYIAQPHITNEGKDEIYELQEAFGQIFATSCTTKGVIQFKALNKPSKNIPLQILVFKR